MTARIIKFTGSSKPAAIVPAGSPPSSVIIMPTVRIENNPHAPADAPAGRRSNIHQSEE